jgi:diguanylate cyclase (GGDEF)-like protein/PAS domain S-box-containing protein
MSPSRASPGPLRGRRPATRRQAALDRASALRMCEAAPLGIFLADANGTCIYSNAACQHITGVNAGRAQGTLWHELVHPQDRERFSAQWFDAALQGRPFQSEVRLLRPDGRTLWVRLNAISVRISGADTAWMLMLEDVSERKSAETVLRAAEQALFAEKERAQVTLNSIGDAVLVTDLALNVTYLNREAVRLTGWSRESALGRPLSEVFRILDGDTLEPARSPAQQAIEQDRTVGLALGCLLVAKDGQTIPIEDSAAPIHNRDGIVDGAVIVFHDAAQSRATLERNAHLARHDALTGLANTALLTERLSQALALARRHRSRIALLYIDLDCFKGVNDVHGHLVGDALLKSVGARLKSCVRATDTVCRHGGDEFVILLEELDCRQDAALAAEKVFASLRAPYSIDGLTVTSSASIGISVYPDDGDDATMLLHRADRDMYLSKASKPLEQPRSAAATVRPPASMSGTVAMRPSSSAAQRQAAGHTKVSATASR